ncbi:MULTISPECIES: TM1802 family CRISPR-associated protein [unclassified Campylobacter]|uniref:TM1802 family CRISPR-associated protein n=1 Tax=unclassified Campylobacter TaxID=2593542 RepID=UPI001473ED2A|nr:MULTISPECIES: TM1802 family CRISPR-associated protein [unclassified Campylobacter]
MGDIIKILSAIGSAYRQDEKRIKNKVYEYDSVKAYLCDIKTQTISPKFYIPQDNSFDDDLVICRFGVGSNSGNLFPNSQFLSKEVNKDEAKFIKASLRSIKNLLSYFEDEEIKNNDILSILSNIDENFFDGIIEYIKGLEEYKDKSKKVATFFCLSFDEKPISAYFKDIFEKHIKKDQKEENISYGYDILTNEQGVGADANLAFCSVNELPDSLKSIKSKLLPLNSHSANKVSIGFLAVDKELSHNFYGSKMVILPTIISKDERLLREILKILEDTKKNDIEQARQSEEIINFALENVAEKEKDIPVLNTILFYNKSNSAIDVLLQIDDVLPSYISKIANKMASWGIKAFKHKNAKEDGEIIYLQNLFNNSLEIMNFLLSQNKTDIDIMMQKYFELIYYGNVNKKYRFIVDWSKYFNNYYPQRSIESIAKYQNLFNEIDVLNNKITIQKECNLEKIKDKKELIGLLIQENEFVKNSSILQGAYLLGMMSSALIKWQYAISKSTSFSRWLNNIGVITKESLERIWTKCYEVQGKLENTAKHSSSNIHDIKECSKEVLSSAFLSKEVVKSSYVTLAFAMGGSDFNKFIKDEKQGEQDE